LINKREPKEQQKRQRNGNGHDSDDDKVTKILEAKGHEYAAIISQSPKAMYNLS
jgi:hypothetical protein